MRTYVALLRAVNLGGDSRLRMADLVRLVERAGFSEVRTALQTGNAVFRGLEEGRREIERRLEERLADSLGLRTDVFVRTAEEWAALVRGNPFRAEAREDPAHLTLWALKDGPALEAGDRLRARITGRERFEIVGRSLYLVYPDGIGRSPVTAAVVERALGTRGTARNWNTVNLLARLSSSGPLPSPGRSGDAGVGTSE